MKLTLCTFSMKFFQTPMSSLPLAIRFSKLLENEKSICIHLK